MVAQKMDTQMKHLSSRELEAKIKHLRKELTKRRRDEAVTLSPKKKREQRFKRQQEETDEVFDLCDLFKNQTRYTDEHFTNVVNKITSLLDESIVVEISERMVKSDKYTIEEYNTLFYTRAPFKSYLNKLQDTNDIEEWKFIGTVKTVETNIRFNKWRLQVGMGTNYSHQIKEYCSVNCYIPSDGRCFIKIFKKLYPSVTNANQMFDDFLFNYDKKDRKGIMTNARFGQFNIKFNIILILLIIMKKMGMNIRNKK